ncbi:MAG TPA: nucleotidyltransferase family protein [Gaiellales bacterium]|nr:nucleotidyltransferase family protein [Gaiellales bacterium]
MLAALILAAGEARRYGGAKQLHPVGGRPMLEVVCATVAASGIAGRTVVLGARAGQVTAAVDMHGAAIVVCERWQDGQAASLLCGLESLAPDVDEALIVLGDGPWLSAEAIRRVAGGSGSGPRAADYGSGRSHPVVLPRSSWSSLPTRGETPGRTVNVRLVDCTDLQAPGDVDYSEA